jgi:hypothetical protein
MQVMIPQQDGAVGADGERVFIAGDGNAGVGCRGVAAVVRHDSASVMFAGKVRNVVRVFLLESHSDVGQNEVLIRIIAQFEGDMMSVVAPVASTHTRFWR